MKSFYITKYDKTSPLKFGDLPIPDISADQVLVEMHYASLNPIDFKIKHGDLKMVLPMKFPLILGNDGSGIVSKIGKNVKHFKVGDEVYLRPDKNSGIGTLAEFIAVGEDELASKPKNLSLEEAASIPLVGLTVWQIYERAGLKKGQKVFIQAGSGGVGTFAIQLAKYLGAEVATTASPKSFEMLQHLGADILIDYKTQNFEDLLKDYDLVLNTQDEETLLKSMKILKPGGKIISISVVPDEQFAIDSGVNWLVKFVIKMRSAKVIKEARKRQVDYSFLLMHSSRKQLEEITSIIEEGKIKPVIDKVFPFNETNEAMNYLESGRAKGKVLVKIR
ncbi:NADP-dependent oxidoreductase [Candidatus Kaistella beijingensis]|uniref:NADP-dependent oxidoreductase n=1 Tax=Candidatus Kaistella beijingensis TaxID=2820270 RepID=UPI001CC5FEC9|nr:NADP-dependent oxidoreductase [Candidatus Kaistella beijingensis]UBB89419.1 NADP-dependent oxidoreductase [Candidatus Kaistella beijingensis]